MSELILFFKGFSHNQSNCKLILFAFHVSKNVFHRVNCLRIKNKNLNLLRNGGPKNIFKKSQYADVDIKFFVWSVQANVVDTRSTGRILYR